MQKSSSFQIKHFTMVICWSKAYQVTTLFELLPAIVRYRIFSLSPASTDWALNWCHLPNKQFPIIFHSSYNESCQEKANPSLFNLKEIDIIEKYVNIMLTFGINRRPIKQSDIGIISPYKRQCQKMSMRFGDNNWSDIEIGTVETFQGREKPIIFISTVRSGSRHVGFLNNPRVSEHI
jgi:helicase MOV-10